MTEEKFTVDRANKYIAENAQYVNNQFKPEKHFSAPIGWINDPNGFVYFRGEYHLFYQYYPYGSFWGPMHWGHAKTRDFVNWEHLPVALAPDMPYDKDGCFSGSAIVKDDVLWLMYTGNVINEDGSVSQIQNMAYSNDGIHFEKIKQNPVAVGSILPDDFIIADFRDPKLFEKDGRYYAVVAAKHKDDVGTVVLLGSDNLVDWKFESTFLKGTKEQGFMWECPDYFEIEGKSYLIFSPMRYPKDGNDFQNINSSIILNGTVDWVNKEFKPETIKEIDHGQDFYAPQSTQGPDGRRIIIAWMHTWGRTVIPHELDHKWACNMTLPRLLVQGKNQNLLQKLPDEMVFLLPVISLGEEIVSGRFEVEVEGNLIYQLGSEKDYIVFGFDATGKEVFIDRSHQLIKNNGEENWPTERCAVSIEAEKIQVVIDRNTIEIFVNDGQEVLSSVFYLQEKHILNKL